MPILRQILIAVAVVAAAGWLWLRYVPSAATTLADLGILSALGIEAPAPAESGGNGGARRGGGPVSVVTADVVEARINDRVAALGDGRALRSVSLRMDTDGLVTRVEAASGRFVEAGDIILTLDDQAERIALDRAVILEEDAREEVQRLERLRSAGSVTVVQTRDAELALKSAELAIAEARYDLDRRTLRAPFSGWIGILDAEEGDRIDGNDVLGTLTDRSQILIDFRVPERVVASLSVGQPVEVRSVAIPGPTLSGSISAIDSVIDRSSRTLRVQATVENQADQLRAGMAFTVEMAFPGAVLPAVPPLAVQWSSEGPFVWAVREGKAQRVDIRIRQRNADLVLVEGSLAPGDTVVTEGVQNLRPGAELRSINQAAADQAAGTGNSGKL